jgi:hypothetical protein
VNALEPPRELKALAASAGALSPPRDGLSPPRDGLDLPLLGGIALLGLACAGALAATGGQPLAALAPPLLCALAWAIWKAPLRATLCCACFAMLALEGEGDASGAFRSPLYGAAMLLHSNLNLSLPLKALRFSGFDALCALLGVVCAARGLSGDRTDRDARLPAGPIARAALGTLCTVLALAAWGLLRGGDVQQIPWQTHQLAFAALLCLLF